MHAVSFGWLFALTTWLATVPIASGCSYVQHWHRHAPVASLSYPVLQLLAGDEMPMYLFDKQFVENAPQLGQEYTVPELFAQDLFSVLGNARPDYR